jgi:hypothetical protein
VLLEPESRWLLLTMALTVWLSGPLWSLPPARSEIRISLLLTLCQAEGVAFLSPR